MTVVATAMKRKIESENMNESMEEKN